MADAGQTPTAAAAVDAHPVGSPAAGAGGASSSSSPSPLKRALDVDVDPMVGCSRGEQPPSDGGPTTHDHADSLSASSTQTPPHLHRDVLQSIFAFLQPKEFVLLTQISREWRTAAVQMPPRQWSVECSTESDLRRLVASPLRRHVRRLTNWTFGRNAQPVILPMTLLAVIAERMAHLDELDCRILLTRGMAPPHWPAKITKLALHLHLDPKLSEDEEIAALMTLVGESLVRQAPMVYDFWIDCRIRGVFVYRIPGELLAPLLQWPLQRLTFDGPVSPEAYPTVRRMAHLTYIRLGRQEQFVQLMSLDGPMPPLEEMNAPSPIEVSEEMLPQLLKLPPTVRKLNLRFVLLAPAPLMPILRHLHTLAVSRSSTCDLARLVSALQQCTQLADLDVDDDEMTEAHLGAILPPMRHLQRLRVRSAGVRSLDFLSHASHLSESLHRLAIGAGELDPTEVRYLRPLRALAELDLNECFTSSLDDDVVSTMTPGADGFLKEVWPHLRTFRWTTR